MDRSSATPNPKNAKGVAVATASAATDAGFAPMTPTSARSTVSATWMLGASALSAELARCSAEGFVTARDGAPARKAASANARSLGRSRSAPAYL